MSVVGLTRLGVHKQHSAAETSFHPHWPKNLLDIVLAPMLSCHSVTERMFSNRRMRSWSADTTILAVRTYASVALLFEILIRHTPIEGLKWLPLALCTDQKLQQ